MITHLLLILLGLVAFWRTYTYMFYKPPNFPPGPPRIPIVGSYLFLVLLNYRFLHKAALWLTKRYKSAVIGLYLGDAPAIILNDFASVKAGLNLPEFDGKPNAALLARLRHPGFHVFGLFFTQHQLWHEQRRFSLRYLRDFGFGRRFESLENEMTEELATVVDWLRYGPKFAHEGKYYRDGNILLPLAFSPFFGNCLLQVWINEKLPRAELHKLHGFAHNGLILQRNGCQYARLFSYIESVAKYFPDLSGYRACRDASNNLFSFVKEIVDAQIATYDPKHERHFIDMYVTKMRAEEQEMADGTRETTTYSIDQLCGTGLDCFFPTLTTVPTQVAMLIQQMFVQPEIQVKIQNEIDSVIGQGRLPTLDDRVNLPYTEACIREIMRYETLLPSGQPHLSMEATEFMGFDIPKDTIIMTALHAAHKDPLRWHEPQQFRPERFLNDEGKLSPQLDYGMPFSAGRRLCIGETFARNAIFLLVAALFQNFTIGEADFGGQVPCRSKNTIAVIKTPPDFWVKVEPR